jgi:hypothetical protein
VNVEVVSTDIRYPKFVLFYFKDVKTDVWRMKYNL